MISNKNISTSHFTKLLKLQRFVSTWTYSRNNKGQKCEGNCGLWVLNEINKKYILQIWKKSWVPFGSYMLNSTANPAHFHSNWAGLAHVISDIGGVIRVFLKRVLTWECPRILFELSLLLCGFLQFPNLQNHQKPLHYRRRHQV